MASDRKTEGLKPPWKKGQSGNPKGAKKGVRHWNVVLREQFEKGRISQAEIAATIIRQAKAGNLRAFEILAEKMDGKTSANLDFSRLLGQDIPKNQPPIFSTNHVAEILRILDEAGALNLKPEQTP